MTVTLFENSSPKLIKASLEALISGGATIVQVVMITKTTYLVLSTP